METYAALIRGGTVETVVVIDPADEGYLATLTETYDAVEVVGDRDRPGAGWSFARGAFVAPVPEPVPEPTAEEVKDAADRENRNTEIVRLTEVARVTLDSTTTTDSEKMRAATFLRGVGES